MQAFPLQRSPLPHLAGVCSLVNHSSLTSLVQQRQRPATKELAAMGTQDVEQHTGPVMPISREKPQIEYSQVTSDMTVCSHHPCTATHLDCPSGLDVIGQGA